MKEILMEYNQTIIPTIRNIFSFRDLLRPLQGGMEEIRAAKDSSVFTIMKKSPYDLYPLRLSASQIHVYLPGVNGYLAQCLNSVLNVRALVGTFNQ